MDQGEDDMTTALRETQEEAGLDKSDLKIMEKTWELSYPVKDWKDGIVRQKSTIYFLAELISGLFFHFSHVGSILGVKFPWNCRSKSRCIPSYMDSCLDKEVILSEEHTDISWADATDSKLLIPAFLDIQKMLDDTIELINCS